MNCLLGPTGLHGHRNTASVPSPGRRPSYWQDLLAVQAVAVQEEGVYRIPGTSSLHRRGRDVQEVLGSAKKRAKHLRSGLPLMEALTPNTGPDPNRGGKMISRLCELGH